MSCVQTPKKHIAKNVGALSKVRKKYLRDDIINPENPKKLPSFHNRYPRKSVLS